MPNYNPRTDQLPRRAGPGRPKGSKNKRTKAIEEWARGFLDSRQYRESLEKRVLSGRAAPGVEALIWQYGYGKPPDRLDVSLEARRVINVIPAQASTGGTAIAEGRAINGNAASSRRALLGVSTGGTAASSRRALPEPSGQ